MIGYALSWKSSNTLAPGDGSFLQPATLGRLTLSQLTQHPIQVGRDSATLGDLFHVEGQPGTRLTVRGLPPLPAVGAGMDGGELIVESDVGHDAGAAMRSGTLLLRGHCGDRLGGSRMTGGSIVVQGNAGSYVGQRMRRGFIVIRGTCGDCPGFQMLAGTLLVLGGPLVLAGVEMRRGTLVTTCDLPPQEHLGYEGCFDATAVPASLLLAKRLVSLTDERVTPRQIRMWSGDRLNKDPGRGEVWQWRH